MRNEQNKLGREIDQNQKSRGKRDTLINQRPLLSKAVRRHLSGSDMKVIGVESHMLS